MKDNGKQVEANALRDNIRNIPKVPPNVRIFSLSFSFFAAAGLMFFAAMLLGVAFAPELIRAGFRSPAGWMLSHMMILGFATMLAMGASMQIVQVLLHVHLFSRMLGFAQFAVYAIGLAILLPSYYIGSFVGIGVGGSIVTAAVLLYAFNLAATFARGRTWNVYVCGVLLSLLALLMTVGLGIAMGVVGGSGTGVQWYGRLFVSHLWFGLGGWMAGLIIAFSFKLLPMFYVSPHKAGASGWWIVGLFQVGIWLKAASVAVQADGLRLLSAGCLLAAMALFLRFMRLVKKKAKPLRGTIPVVAGMNAAVAALFGVWLVGREIWPTAARLTAWTEALVVFLVAGWFAAGILGYMARIVPFLWWAYRFHTVWQKKSKVLLSNMVPERRMGVELWMFCAAVGVTAVSIGLAWPPGAVIGQAAALITAVVYVIDLSKVFRY